MKRTKYMHIVLIREQFAWCTVQKSFSLKFGPFLCLFSKSTGTKPNKTEQKNLCENQYITIWFIKIYAYQQRATTKIHPNYM